MGAVSELFDTNILIDHLNGVAKATREITRSKNPAISVITWIEVMTGAASSSEEAILRAFLANFQYLEMTREVAERGCGDSAAEEVEDAGCDYSGDG
ncbi:MAG: PIN domain-containing protein [Edaphobacter sp.]